MDAFGHNFCVVLQKAPGYEFGGFAVKEDWLVSTHCRRCGQEGRTRNRGPGTGDGGVGWGGGVGQAPGPALPRRCPQSAPARSPPPPAASAPRQAEFQGRVKAGLHLVGWDSTFTPPPRGGGGHPTWSPAPQKNDRLSGDGKQNGLSKNAKPKNQIIKKTQIACKILQELPWDVSFLL